jgi:hypothetical protein
MVASGQTPAMTSNEAAALRMMCIKANMQSPSEVGGEFSKLWVVSVEIFSPIGPLVDDNLFRPSTFIEASLFTFSGANHLHVGKFPFVFHFESTSNPM